MTVESVNTMTGVVTLPGLTSEGELPSSVVSGSPTGGVLVWKATTAYSVNQLVASGGVTYICLEAHTSGATFSGVGSHWEVLGGPAVVTSVLKQLGEVSGEVVLNLNEGDTFVMTATANVTIPIPTGTVPRAEYSIVAWLLEDAIGGHTFSFTGFSLLGEASTLSTIAKAANRIEFTTYNGGATWYRVGLQAGPAGPTGATGGTGPEGFWPAKLLLPKSIRTYVKPNEATEWEGRSALVESIPRNIATGSLALTSGTPIVAPLIAPPNTTIGAIGFQVQALEGTSANRTHLWVALLNSAGETLAVSEDYTSSTHTPLVDFFLNALKLTSTHKSGAEGELLYALLVEVMSSTACITIAFHEGSAPINFNNAPKIAATANAGQTVPGSLPSPITFGETAKIPYLIGL